MRDQQVPGADACRDSVGQASPASPPSGDATNTSGLRKVVVLCREADAACAHEVAAARAAGSRIADWLGLQCEVVAIPCADAARCYWIPMGTLSSRELAELGMAEESQLWGGAVPYPHVATKLVSHPLWKPDARAAPGWRELPDIAACTLPGFSVFHRSDAGDAARALLAEGPVRMKCPYERGGHGQSSITNLDELSRWLDEADDTLFDHGMVIERELVDAVTYSVGSSRLPGCAIAYHGEQRTVADRAGATVYGGSSLSIRKGGLPELQATLPPGELAEAVAAAMRYDRAVCEGYGVIASRRNYDVIAGVDGAGRRCIGVLEQSWRIGGASMAEVLAAERLAQHPGLEWVIAETVESYDGTSPPSDALVYWPGDADAPCKYARIVGDGH